MLTMSRFAILSTVKRSKKNFDTKLQNLEFTLHRNRGDRITKDDLLFKTIDGNDISLDVIIVYRIDPAAAPLIIQKVARNNQELRDKIVRTVSRSKPRDIFGELKTEELKLEIAEALQNKKIFLLPVSEGGMNLKTTDINALLNTMGVKSLSSK